jgi:hypothetical protein
MQAQAPSGSLGIRPAPLPDTYCSNVLLAKQFAKGTACESWECRMRERNEKFDYGRYRQLLAEAVDDTKRIALINLLIEERARDRLAAALDCDRAAATAMRISQVLGTSRP